MRTDDSYSCSALLLALAVVGCGAADPEETSLQTGEAQAAAQADVLPQMLIDAYFVDNYSDITGMCVGYTKAGLSPRVVCRGQRTPVDTSAPNGNTIFYIGSVSKTLTAALLANKVLAGERSYEDKLDDRIEVNIPNDAVDVFWKRSITLRQLATHTSGLARNPSDMPPDVYTHSYTRSELYDAFIGDPLEYIPMNERVYSNMGYGLLFWALEPFDGSPSAKTQIENRITEPLGMDDTQILLPASKLGRMAQAQGNQLDQGSRFGPAGVGSGGYHSTTNDMIKWMRWHLGQISLHGGSPSSPDAEVLEMTKNHKSKVGFAGGLAWEHAFDFPSAGKITMTKGGATDGFRAYALFTKGTGTSVVVLQAGESSPKTLARDILCALEGPSNLSCLSD